MYSRLYGGSCSIKYCKQCDNECNDAFKVGGIVDDRGSNVWTALDKFFLCSLSVVCFYIGECNSNNQCTLSYRTS